MPLPKDPTAFTDTMADLLRLPDEALAMSYIYANQYKKFHEKSQSAEPDPLDSYTLALATLSLAAKATESPRRLREILLPAHRLLHPPAAPPEGEHDAPPNRVRGTLKVPSEAYDSRRATLVQAELILLRVLGFELRRPSPMAYLPRYLERAMEDVADAGEDYEGWPREERAEYGVVEGGWMETGLGRRAREVVVKACKEYRLANLFPARAVTLGCLYVAMQDRGLRFSGDLSQWVDQITSRKVDMEDFAEILEVLRKL